MAQRGRVAVGVALLGALALGTALLSAAPADAARQHSSHPPGEGGGRQTPRQKAEGRTKPADTSSARRGSSQRGDSGGSTPRTTPRNKRVLEDPATQLRCECPPPPGPQHTHTHTSQTYQYAA